VPEGFVNQYLAALTAGDPGKLPLAKNAHYTENGHPVILGLRLKIAIRRSAKWKCSRGADSRGQPVPIGTRLSIRIASTSRTA
jgi:hypothetical protein